MKDPIASALADALKSDPPQSRVQATISALQGQEQSIRAAIEKGWTPAALAKKFRAAGVKVSEGRLRTEIQSIAGIPARKVRRGTVLETTEA